jgi:hypothetical protein
MRNGSEPGRDSGGPRRNRNARDEQYSRLRGSEPVIVVKRRQLTAVV